MNIFDPAHQFLSTYITLDANHYLLSILYFISGFLLLGTFYTMFKKIALNRIRSWLGASDSKHVTYIVNNHIISRLVKLIFSIILSQFSLLLPHVFVNTVTHGISNLFVIFFSAAFTFSMIGVSYDILKNKKINEMLPLKALVQLAKLIVIITTGIFAMAFILGKSPLVLLGGIGAFSAVLMIVFKDSILNLVAVFQIRLQKSINIGDWIEMTKYGADGDVSEINLSGVIVVNFDKTTTVVPPSAFLTNSFKNYASMSTTARRIKRDINIDIGSIRFLKDEEIKELANIPVLENYLSSKKNEINNKNSGLDGDEVPFKGKALTNIGTFREYIDAYLSNSDHISNEHTLLVRQLQPGNNGVPIQLYCFTSDTGWIHFEKVQSDIFDHLLAIAPVFGLKVFQSPSGGDFNKLV
jgi:miniconductance mechanosensitive channel